MKNLSIFIRTSFKNIRLDQTKNRFMIFKTYFTFILLAVLVESNVSIEFIFIFSMFEISKTLDKRILSTSSQIGIPNINLFELIPIFYPCRPDFGNLMSYMYLFCMSSICYCSSGCLEELSGTWRHKDVEIC